MRNRTEINRLYRRIKGDICIYCGDNATVGDHAYPAAAALKGHRPRNRKMLIIVPACQDCNYVASDYVFETLEEKRKFIKRKLEKKYRKFLCLPDWTEEELNTLCPSLRNFTESGLILREWVRARIKWMPLAENVDQDLSESDSGKDSVPLPAA